MTKNIPTSLPFDAARDVTVLRLQFASWKTKKINNYIEEHLAERITVAALSLLANLSQAHFCRAFRENYGTNLQAYILQQRVERAQLLIATTTAPLGQIALDCGFSDQAHLTRMFRRHTETTPHKWRHSPAASKFAAAASHVSGILATDGDRPDTTNRVPKVPEGQPRSPTPGSATRT